MDGPVVRKATWFRKVQTQVHKAPDPNSLYTERAIKEAAEKNLQTYLERVEKKIIRKANKGHRIFVIISGHSEYRIMFFYQDKYARNQFIRVPHRKNKQYNAYPNQNKALYNQTYLEAARRELNLDVNTTDYLELPFN